MFKKINSIEEGKWLNAKSFLICLLLIISFILVPQIIGSILYYGRGVDERISMLIGNTFLAIIYLIVFFPTFKKQFKEYKNNFADSIHTILKVWGIGLAIMMASNLVLNTLVFPGEIAKNEELNREFLKNYQVVGFFEIVLIGPFIEEMIFRFAIRKGWGKNKAYPIVSGFIFAFLHALAGVNSSSDLIYLLYTIPYGALGYAFGYLYQKSDNIFFSLTAHMIHNLLTFALIIFFV